jgi:hypothetical protein
MELNCHMAIARRMLAREGVQLIIPIVAIRWVRATKRPFIHQGDVPFVILLSSQPKFGIDCAKLWGLGFSLD